MNEETKKVIREAIIKTKQKVVDNIRSRIARLEDDKRMWLKVLGEKLLESKIDGEDWTESKIKSTIEYYRVLVDGCQKAITELENIISEIHGMGTEID